jgi:4'-phosphopantetheinyl transferase
MAASALVHLVDGRAIADAQLDAYLGWLGAGEMARYQRFLRRERRRQFVIGRVLARQALGELLGVAPRALLIDDRPGQAPLLAGPHSTTSFSISHSGPWIACAVSADSALGIDIEQFDGARDIDALAAHAFDAERCAWLAARPAHSRLRDFYNLWSAHEARIKLGAQPAMTVELSHPDLSVVLCSAVALSQPPQLRPRAL